MNGIFFIPPLLQLLYSYQVKSLNKACILFKNTFADLSRSTNPIQQSESESKRCKQPVGAHFGQFLDQRCPQSLNDFSIRVQFLKFIQPHWVLGGCFTFKKIHRSWDMCFLMQNDMGINVY